MSAVSVEGSAVASGALPAFLQRCLGCAAVVFPPRLACRACGGDRFEASPAGVGVVEEVTVLPGGLRIASVRVQGVLVVCSSGAPLTAGASVAVVGSPADPAGLPAQVYLPGSASTAILPGSAHIENLPGSAHIENLPGSAHIENLPGSAHIENLPGSAHIENEGTP